jgi:hypothetical protein
MVHRLGCQTKAGGGVRSLAAFEYFRIFSRRSTLLVPVILSSSLLIFGMLPYVARFTELPGPLRSVSQRDLAVTSSTGFGIFLRTAYGGLETRPDDLAARTRFWSAFYWMTYEPGFFLYAVVLALIAFATGAAALEEPGSRLSSSPLLALPIPEGRQMAGRILGRTGVVFAYHTAIWPFWAFLAMNSPYSTAGILSSFVWPMILAALFVTAGHEWRRLGMRWDGKGQLVLGLLPVAILVVMAAGIFAEVEWIPGWLDPVTVASCPGLAHLTGGWDGQPWYLRNLTLLAGLALLCAIGFRLDLGMRGGRDVL